MASAANSSTTATWYGRVTDCCVTRPLSGPLSPGLTFLPSVADDPEDRSGAASGNVTLSSMTNDRIFTLFLMLAGNFLRSTLCVEMAISDPQGSLQRVAQLPFVVAIVLVGHQIGLHHHRHVGGVELAVDDRTVTDETA